MASQEESGIVEDEIDTARTLSPLQFFQPGNNPQGTRDEGDFQPHAQRVDQQSTVVFEGTDMDHVSLIELSSGDIDPRDPRHDHTEYDPAEEAEEDEDKETPVPADQMNLQVPFSTP